MTIIDISKREKILEKFPNKPIIETPEQIEKYMMWAEETTRESNYKSGMSSLSAGEFYIPLPPTRMFN